MVITCPSCSARYRLNPKKVQGRGAKITCPKCSHVFVVFTDETEAADASGSSPAPAAPKPAAAKPAPKPAARARSAEEERAATTTGAFAAVGIDPAAAKGASSNNIRIVAPGSRSTRRMSTLSTPGSAVPTSGEDSGVVAIHRTGESATLDEEIRSAGELDFRSVGIKTWKVKVAIGLIYDFSDISTLKKYLDDKKVTRDDLISHNNADWTRIGDIEDLERHFIDTWKAAKAAVDSGEVEAPKPKKKPEPTATGSHSALAAVGSSTGSFKTDRSALTSNAYPAQARRRPAKSPVEQTEEEEKRRPIAAIAVIAAVAAVAAFLLWPKTPAPPQAGDPSVGGTATTVDTADADRKALEERIARDLEEQRKRITEEQEPLEAEVADEGEEEDRSERLVPVAPDQQTTTVRRAEQPVRQPTMQPPRYEAPSRVVEQASPASSGSTAVKTAADPARMYLTLGRKKLSSGDFGSARTAFQTAIAKNAQCAECYAGLAEAEQGLGNSEAAAAAKAKSASLGNTQSLASP